MDKKNKGVVQPKPNWRSIQERQKEEIRLRNIELENKKKNIKFFQRVGLLAGLIGAAYNLNYAPVIAREIESGKSKISADTLPSTEVLRSNFDKAWSEVVSKITPVLRPQAENLTQVNVLQENLPTITRKLTIEELNDSNERFTKLDEVEKKDTFSSKSTPVVDKTPTGTPTPLANVDTKPNLEGTLETSVTFKSPFEYREANIVMSDLNLDLADLFYTEDEKIKNFDSLYSETEILPIFPEEVNQWAPLVVDLCNKHNEINKDFPNRQINPNFILAIMSIESQGNQGVESHMAAKGLMQITTPIAEYYGFNEKTIYKPSNNIQASISYFADLKDMASKLGLQGKDIYEYAAMSYNGGWNADKYFMTSRVEEILGSKSVATKIFNAEDIEGVKEALLAVKGNINSEGNEYFTFGTRLTKVETLKYREKIVRFVVIAEIADEIRDGLVKKGFTEDKANQLARKFIKTSDFIKSVNKRIRSEAGPKNYFEERESFENFLRKRFNVAELPEYTDDVTENPAYYLMYR